MFFRTKQRFNRGEAVVNATNVSHVKDTPPNGSEIFFIQSSGGKNETVESSENASEIAEKIADALNTNE